MKLQPVDYEMVAPWRSAAAREHVAVAESPGTQWFVWLRPNNEIVGFCGLLRTRTGGRIKGVYVLPGCRGNGHGRAMTEALIWEATDGQLMQRLEALALNPAFYESMGWKRVGAPRPNGAVMVAKTF